MLFLFLENQLRSQPISDFNSWLSNEQAKDHSLDLSSSQILGYTGIAIGATTIVYTIYGIDETKKNPDAYYIAGGAMVVGGICALIFGKKKKSNSWNGVAINISRKKENNFNLRWLNKFI